MNWGTEETLETITYSAISTLTVETGSGTNSVEVQSTSSAGVTINAQGGTDNYTVNLGILAGPVTVATTPAPGASRSRSWARTTPTP